MQVFVQFSHISIILFIILTNVLRNAQNAKLFKWSIINIFGKKEQHCITHLQQILSVLSKCSKILQSRTWQMHITNNKKSI